MDCMFLSCVCVCACVLTLSPDQDADVLLSHMSEAVQKMPPLSVHVVSVNPCGPAVIVSMKTLNSDSD